MPGILPPVIENGEVLVDGGILNNLPVDVMRAMGRGPVIGVDVAANRALISADLDLDEASLWRLLRRDRRRVPWILNTLMRAGTVSSDAQAAALQREADVILAPPLESVDLLDWKAFDRIVELGYRYTMTELECHDASPLVRIVSALAPTTRKE
jgi:NTE family protein